MLKCLTQEPMRTIILNDSDDNFDNQITSSEESDALSDAESFETGQV